MNENTVVGLFNDTKQAESTIAELKGSGVLDTDISYLYVAESESGEIDTRDASGTKVGSGASSGAGAGALIGGLAGLAVANGILPGLGTLFVAGPLATALGLTGAVATTAAGAITGAAAGTLIGALAGLGISSDEAKVYEERIKQGSVLVAAKGENTGALRDIFERNGAENIKTFSA